MFNFTNNMRVQFQITTYNFSLNRLANIKKFDNKKLVRLWKNLDGGEFILSIKILRPHILNPVISFLGVYLLDTLICAKLFIAALLMMAEG